MRKVKFVPKRSKQKIWNTVPHGTGLVFRQTAAEGEGHGQHMLGNDVAVAAGGGAEDRSLGKTATVHIVVDTGGGTLHKFQVAAQGEFVVLRLADDDVGRFQMGLIVFGFKNQIAPVREIRG